MARRAGVRKGIQKQGQTQVQIQTTMRRRAGVEELSTWQETAVRPGVSPRGGDLGYDEEADGDQLLDDGEESGSSEPTGDDCFQPEESDDEPQIRHRLTVADLLGSRPPVVLLRLSLENGAVAVRTCARPASRDAGQALELLRDFVTRCFQDGRAHFTDAEWDQLLGNARRRWSAV